MTAILILLSFMAGILYRMGGGGFDLWIQYRFLPRWAFDTKARDVGVPLCMLVYMAAHWHWTLIFCFGLMWGAQTTYFKRSGEDARWYNWLFCGLAFSVAMFPYAIATHHFTGFLLRACIVTLFVPVWSVAIGNDFWEEFMRGFIQIITLPIFLI